MVLKKKYVFQFEWRFLFECVYWSCWVQLGKEMFDQCGVFENELLDTVWEEDDVLECLLCFFVNGNDFLFFLLIVGLDMNLLFYRYILVLGISFDIFFGWNEIEIYLRD